MRKSHPAIFAGPIICCSTINVQLATLEQDMVVVKQLSIMLNVCIAN